MKNLGSRINQLRTKKQWSMQELADKCEISKSYVNDLEKGKVNPSLSTLVKMAEQLNTKVSVLIGEKNMDESAIDIDAAINKLTKEEYDILKILLNKLLL